MMLWIAAYLSVVAVMSLVCFITYGFDKRCAARGNRRVRESTLHTLEFLGGWPGALLGQRYFRHKTQKASFLITFWLLVLLHLSAVGIVIYALSAANFTAPDQSVEIFSVNGRPAMSQSGDESGRRITPA
jgi:uncharacterized membrane protein YsdA (DUF1294 family)